jgi:hypothetical protein
MCFISSLFGFDGVIDDLSHAAMLIIFKLGLDIIKGADKIWKKTQSALELLGHVDMMLSKHQGEILNKSSEQNEHEIIQTADQAPKKKY